MNRYIALIRGINVGTAKRVAMKDLAAVVAGLGYGDVRTLLNSGNVIFTTHEQPERDPADKIEEAMRERLGVSARVVVVTAKELAEIVEEDPLCDIATNPSRHLVAFVASSESLAALAAVAQEEWAPEAFAVGKRAAYLWCPDGVHSSKLAKAVERAVKKEVTMRNWATVEKLRDLVEAGD